MVYYPGTRRCKQYTDNSNIRCYFQFYHNWWWCKYYAAIIKSADKNHEAQDGVVATGTTLRSQTDVQEGQGTGSYTNVKYIPVDTGVDFEPTSTADNITKSLGAFYPFIDTSITWATSAGTIGGAGYSNGDSVNVDLGASVLRTFANEPVLENYVLSGDSIGASGLTFDTSTGILSGTVTVILKVVSR